MYILLAIIGIIVLLSILGRSRPKKEYPDRSASLPKQVHYDIDWKAMRENTAYRDMVNRTINKQNKD